MNDALGRRVPLLAAGALCTVAALLGATTDVFWWLLVVRCLFGIGMGINKCVLSRSAALHTPRRCAGNARLLSHTRSSHGLTRTLQRVFGDLLRRDHAEGGAGGALRRFAK